MTQCVLVGLHQPSELRALLSAPGPCLTVCLPLSTASEEGVNPREKQNELRWKECLRSLQERAKQFGTAGNKLIESASDWNAVKKDAGGNTKEARSIVA